MATLVISDAHGYPRLIENALEHAGFRPGVDTLVYAGDFLDRGPESARCLELVERYATEVLIGNHELAALLRVPIWPQDPISPTFRPLLIERVLGTAPGGTAHLRAAPGGTPLAGAASAGQPAAGPGPAGAAPACRGPWKVATLVEGVLVTHGGVSSRYQTMFIEECGSDPALLAERLNQEFVAAVTREMETGEWDERGIFGDDGPVWFRPAPWSRLQPLDGVVQVAGHTPPQQDLEASGFYMIDPCAWLMDFGEPGQFRYAVIEDGQVRVTGGTLDSDRPDHAADGDVVAAG